MNNRPTPETDAACWREGFGVNSECVHAEFARKLERERDEAREKIERQADRIRYLEGATNHAKGTPLSVALRERDEARDIAEKLSKQGLDMIDENKSLKRERDEARRKLNNLDVTEIHSCHNECQRPICVLRRERDEAREALNKILKNE